MNNGLEKTRAMVIAAQFEDKDSWINTVISLYCRYAK
jgi:hypothetical protein